MPEIDLSTTYMGLRLPNPVVVSSSGLTASLDNLRRCAEAGAGAVVLKSIFEEQIAAESAEEVRDGETFGFHVEAEEYLARYGREDAFGRYLELIAAAKRALPVPVIASVHCVSAGGWVDLAERVQQAGADALELNVFALPADPRRDAAGHEKLYFDVARAVVRRVSIPVALKVGPYFSGLARTLVELSKTGVGALVLFNRFLPIDFDLDTLEVVPGVIYSTPAEMHLPLRWISILSGRVRCELAAATGVHDGAAVVKQLLAGAAAVQVCSALYQRGIPYLGTMVREVGEWMAAKGFGSIEQLRGRLAQKHVADPAAHERVQFMKATGVE
jgi:dihydroorotate dehydrogenase (fumarate)